ncbi:hypothetical protein GCM10020254_84380 [Streptomyces goshikiensis]
MLCFGAGVARRGLPGRPGLGKVPQGHAALRGGCRGHGKVPPGGIEFRPVQEAVGEDRLPARSVGRAEFGKTGGVRRVPDVPQQHLPLDAYAGQETARRCRGQRVDPAGVAGEGGQFLRGRLVAEVPAVDLTGGRPP